MKNVQNPLAALKQPNFRYYWLGMCVSLIGTWMQNIAQPWLAYSLTKSPFLLSLIGALQFTPMLLFSLFAGVVIDKFSKRKILILTQSASLVITLALALLVWTGQVQYWHLIISATLLGMVNTLDMPTRQSFVIELTGKEYLMNAIALNSAVFNMARILGPAVAGYVMGRFGISVCFFANAISFAAVVVSLLIIRPVTPVRPPVRNSSMLRDIGAGLSYIRRTPVILRTLAIVCVVATFAVNFSVLVPVFAKDILGQGEQGFGMLMSFMGVGSFSGAMFMAFRSKQGPQRKFLIMMPLLVSALLIFTGQTAVYGLTALGLALTGFFFVTFSSSANSMLQYNTRDEFRGRVMSVYAITFGGTVPIGNLYAGAITEHFGARAGFMACGLIVPVLLIPVLLFFRDQDKSVPVSHEEAS